MTKQVITLTSAAYELLISQIEAMPYALAKPLLQLLRSNAQPMNVEISDASQVLDEQDRRK